MIRTILATLFVFFISIQFVHAQDEMLCVDREKILSKLKEKYEEIPVFRGLTNTGAMIELLQSPNKTSWSLIVTNPDLNAKGCIIAAGSVWFPLNIEIDEPTSYQRRSK